MRSCTVMQNSPLQSSTESRVISIIEPLATIDLHQCVRPAGTGTTRRICSQHVPRTAPEIAHRIDPAPRCFNFIFAHEQRLVAAKGTGQQALVGTVAACSLAAGEMQVERSVERRVGEGCRATGTLTRVE